MNVYIISFRLHFAMGVLRSSGKILNPWVIFELILICQNLSLYSGIRRRRLHFVVSFVLVSVSVRLGLVYFHFRTSSIKDYFLEANVNEALGITNCYGAPNSQFSEQNGLNGKKAFRITLNSSY